MADRLDPRARSELMRRVKSADTKPEIIVRKLAHAAGYRYRLHARDLPGKPDLVFWARRKAVFVHGCFWHGHGCKVGQLPKSRLEFWVPKITRNKERDLLCVQELEAAGWQSLTVWQCELKDVPAVSERVVDFLGPPRRS